jgi:hypothetical protein
VVGAEGRLMRVVKIVFLVLFFIASVVLSCRIVNHSLAAQKLKNDLAELNSVKYGFLSIDAWNRQITAILAEEIGKLELSKTDKKALRKYIEDSLNVLIDEAFRKMRELNSTSFRGRIKQAFLNIFLSKEDIKKGIPEYADAVIAEMTKPGAVRWFKSRLIEKLNQYSRQTFEPGYDRQIRDILERLGYRDLEEARTGLEKRITDKSRLIVWEAAFLIGLAIVLFSAAGFGKRSPSPFLYFVLVSSLIVLLTAGITTPMIDLEARLSHLGFVIMGHNVHFENQVLYFQSKSIIDVFRILITSPKAQMKFVGILLITFSIVFPLAKILFTVPYYYDYRHARENRIVAFFIEKSGKWSMADVMVVAMFMAYVGFNGIIDNQFEELKAAVPHVDMITSNGTSLQPGYYLFLAYCLLGMFLSGFLAKKPFLAERRKANVDAQEA